MCNSVFVPSEGRLPVRYASIVSILFKRLLVISSITSSCIAEQYRSTMTRSASAMACPIAFVSCQSLMLSSIPSDLSSKIVRSSGSTIAYEVLVVPRRMTASVFSPLFRIHSNRSFPFASLPITPMYFTGVPQPAKTNDVTNALPPGRRTVRRTSVLVPRCRCLVISSTTFRHPSPQIAT